MAFAIVIKLSANFSFDFRERLSSFNGNP